MYHAHMYINLITVAIQQFNGWGKIKYKGK